MAPTMTTLEAALWISLISLIVLFAASFVLWGLMALLARIPSKGEEPDEEALEIEAVPALPEATGTPEKETQRKQRAAALAVAVALALQPSKRILSMPKDGNGTTFSAWKAVQRASSMSQRNGIFTRKTRG